MKKPKSYKEQQECYGHRFAIRQIECSKDTYNFLCYKSAHVVKKVQDIWKCGQKDFIAKFMDFINSHKDSYNTAHSIFYGTRRIQTKHIADIIEKEKGKLSFEDVGIVIPSKIVKNWRKGEKRTKVKKINKLLSPKLDNELLCAVDLKTRLQTLLIVLFDGVPPNEDSLKNVIMIMLASLFPEINNDECNILLEKIFAGCSTEELQALLNMFVPNDRRDYLEKFMDKKN